MTQTEQTTSRANLDSVCNAFGAAFRELGRAVAPPESLGFHFREARKHMLLAVREIIDDRIQKLSRTEQKGTQVPVD